MENQDKNEVLSRAVKAGKRTYFFDVKSTKTGEMYLTITESKRKFNDVTGTFFYEKHKVFLYKEDFEKFQNALNGMVDFITTGKIPEEVNNFESEEKLSERDENEDYTNLDFTL
ncbi:MAG: PUR family DNA/RNA-binding protein [Bacteroidales bacterium]|nr:PUR family DNA/RNA-binding protein [Bacteroidales bacterium]